MKVILRIQKNGHELLSQACEIEDAESFGKACAEAWDGLRAHELGKETSIGAVMEHMHDSILDLLCGATITLSPE